jgi:hypothetical protein
MDFKDPLGHKLELCVDYQELIAKVELLRASNDKLQQNEKYVQTMEMVYCWDCDEDNPFCKTCNGLGKVGVKGSRK